MPCIGHRNANDVISDSGMSKNRTRDMGTRIKDIGLSGDLDVKSPAATA